MIAFKKEPVSATYAKGVETPTSAEIHEACEEMKNLSIKPPTPDVLLMTYEIFEQVENNTPLGQLVQDPPTIGGIPFEVYDTVDQCKLRAMVLQSQGKLPMIAFGFVN